MNGLYLIYLVLTASLREELCLHFLIDQENRIIQYSSINAYIYNENTHNNKLVMPRPDVHKIYSVTQKSKLQ